MESQSSSSAVIFGKSSRIKVVSLRKTPLTSMRTMSIMPILHW